MNNDVAMGWRYIWCIISANSSIDRLGIIAISEISDKLTDASDQREIASYLDASILFLFVQSCQIAAGAELKECENPKN